MCCSIRAAVFFLASVHIFFSVTQMVHIVPVAVGRLGEKVLESAMAFVFCVLFFATGFMTFRGADEESATMVRLGAFCLALVIILRFVLLSLSLMLIETIPEASFLYVYKTPVIPVMFTVILYLVYLAILFCYYKELRHESTSQSQSQSQHASGSSSGQNHPGAFIFQSPTPMLRPHILGSSASASMYASGLGLGRAQTP